MTYLRKSTRPRGPVIRSSCRKAVVRNRFELSTFSICDLSIMSDAIITVENLGKKYRLQHQQNGGMRYKAIRDVIADKFKGLFRSSSSQLPTSNLVEDFWALRNVSFEIK